jgi:citrate synthase
MHKKIISFVKYNKLFLFLYRVFGNCMLLILRLFFRVKQNRVLFMSFGGQKFDDSPRALFEAMKKEIRDWTDEEEIRDYLKRMLNKDAFDKSGLIYGIGHAVYTVSDPRCNIFKNFVEKLAEEKGRQKEFVLYSNIHRLAPEVVAEHKQMQKKVSANIDFYSGFVYSMLDLPQELYTPIFAIARISGWSAHRIEELVNSSKIIRPAYLSVQPERPYVKLEDR